MWSYLFVLGGMGYEGGPIEAIGGWGKDVVSAITCNEVGFSAISIVCKVMMRCMFCLTLKGDAMYTVAVRWGELVKTHKAWTLSDAKATMYAYPNKDVFIKVTNLFGQRVAVRYYR